MDDLSEGTVPSQMGDLTGVSENRPDKQSGEELSACLERTYWNRLPVEIQIEIVKQKNLDNGDKLNLLCAYPDLLSVISESYPHDSPNTANGGKDTETEPPDIYIKYLSKEKMFCDEMAGFFGSRQPPKIFGLKHNRVVLTDLDSESKHTSILLGALESTSTTARKLCFDVNEADFQLSLDFAKVLKSSCLQLTFRYNKKGTTLNELVEAFPALFELNELSVLGPVNADGDSLFRHLSKFPPSLCFNNTSFLHDGHVVKFLRTLVSTKFEEGSPAAASLKRIVNWTFDISYEIGIEEGETMNSYKLLSELVADIIPPDSKIMNLDSAMGTVERRIFELHLAVGDEQHVIYVKEEIDNLHRYRAIQLANQTADFCEVVDSPDSSIISDMVEQVSIFDSDPDPDFSDANDDYPDYDDFEDDDY
ncbi:hypothetical protein WR25_16745 [Diploscapter pachys]|uniref:Uncharacterized protein n=1 Tax=Diploscapter pachys TaxID=2018661 RepID=A0A2A2J5U6_9BILA|nr:hypothetical protein WR25_16745 [Diploscapter pachys]